MREAAFQNSAGCPVEPGRPRRVDQAEAAPHRRARCGYKPVITAIESAATARLSLRFMEISRFRLKRQPFCASLGLTMSTQITPTTGMFILPGLAAILALAVVFLSSPPDWVRGAGAGAGAAVAAVAVQAGLGLTPDSWRRSPARGPSGRRWRPPARLCRAAPTRGFQTRAAPWPRRPGRWPTGALSSLSMCRCPWSGKVIRSREKRRRCRRFPRRARSSPSPRWSSP